MLIYLYFPVLPFLFGSFFVKIGNVSIKKVWIFKIPSRKRLMFKKGDKIVYPLHGAGEIDLIEKKEILGEAKKYYVIKLLSNGMNVMVPVDQAKKLGLRSIIDKSEVQKVLNILRDKSVEKITSWKVRYHNNLEKLKSGSIYKVAEVARNLTWRNKEKKLSSGEKKMLENARSIIISEIAYAKSIEYHQASLLVESILNGTSTSQDKDINESENL
jgi:CarD family transcriptional regulator